MHHPIFEQSFAMFVALILLPWLVFYFLNNKKGCVRRNTEDAHTGAFGSMNAPTKTNFGGSSLSPAGTDDVAFSLSSIDANNGASSSMTAPIGNCYEVFLSFRGLDTRNSFTDHLYNGLLEAGIDAFRDDDELCQGEDIRPDLVAAITNRKILIPILSVNYGASSWCLDELVQLIECRNDNNGQIVLPVFYKVKPADVGHQIGSFGGAFHERERRLLKRRFDPAILEKWKQALLGVSTLKGCEADG
ncbi:disease resistance protein L6-like [Rhodamnia argentea]|uniref:ADP-ribosyl cyclase/cyclic ADP-ribose hydrolase n=1 Tax=Rhodamnia argentea TaxID=178133 RepID=A0A8B8N734_9MYRT|nr:disease resistance protein L6-like [Rhodamnia argentea]